MVRSLSCVILTENHRRFTDTIHSIFIWFSIWDYCVSNFGNQEYMDHIPWSIALTIVFTVYYRLFLVQILTIRKALMTFLVHWYVPEAPLALLILMSLDG